MRELLFAIKTIGLPQLLKLRRARRWGWEGIIKGYFLTRAIQTFMQVGLLERCKTNEEVDVKAFAAEHRLDGELVYALCDYLYARRILKKNGMRFSLDKDGRFLADNDLMQGWFMLAHGYEPALHELMPLVSGTLGYGRDVVRDGELVARGSGLASAALYFPMVAEMVRQAGHRKVLDIGCGDVTFLRYLCRVVPGLQGVGVDLSADAVRSGQEQLAGTDLEGRITLIDGDAGDMSAHRVALDGVTAATTFFVLHELADHGQSEKLAGFFSRFSETLPDASLIMVETIRPDTEELRAKPGPALDNFFFHHISGK